MKWVNSGRQNYNPLQQMTLNAGLRDAVRNGDDPMIVSGWLAKGAQVNPEPAVDGVGFQPTPLLHLAARMGRSTVVELLIGKDYENMDIRDNQGRNALHVAALAGQDGSARLLLQMGLDAKATDEYGFTPVDLAFARGHDKVINMFRHAGVEVEEPEDMQKLRESVALTYPEQSSHVGRQQQRAKRNEGPQFPIR